VTTRRPGVRAPVVLSIASGLVGIPLASTLAHAQSQSPPATPERRFEVASIKPSPNTAQDRVAALQQRFTTAARAAMDPNASAADAHIYPGGRWRAVRIEVRALLLIAFDLHEYQLEGGPSWVTTEYFDINASAGGDATAAEYRAMLRSLLVDRFALKTHTETRQVPVQVLTLARTDGRLGPNLKPTSAECAATVAERQRTKTPPPRLGPPPEGVDAQRAVIKSPRCGAITSVKFAGEGTSVAAGGTPITLIVDRVSMETKSPVIDRTALTGLYDFLLEYEPARAAGALPANAPTDVTPYAPMPKALQQQLGLRLETEPGPLPVVVIEAISHPTPD
jgi:uncharacterized protein (TIGR03435 family)